MKQFGYETDNAGSEITFVKKASAALGAGAVAMLAVGAVGVYAFVGGKSIPVNSTGGGAYLNADTTVSQAEDAETVSDSRPDTYGSENLISPAAVTLKKAGIDEYDLVIQTVNAVETKTSKKSDKKKTSTSRKKTTSSDKKSDDKKQDTSKKTEAETSVKTTTAKAYETEAASQTSTATAVLSAESSIDTEVTVTKKSKKKTETSTDTTLDVPEEIIVLSDTEDEPEEIVKPLDADSADEVKTCAAMTLYTKEKVNLRSGASLNDDVMVVIPEGGEVIVTGYTDDWYRVKYDGSDGFCMKKYLTETKPESVSAVSDGSVITYTDEEFNMLTYVLQGEVGNCSEASKIAVANVIINRVKDPRFPDSISGVLTQEDQFTAIYGYYSGSTAPSDNTIECAKRALAGEDNTNGAIYYYAPQYVGGSTASWFESLELCLELDGQRYFK